MTLRIIWQSPETVSRALTELKTRRIISLEGVREVLIQDRKALEDVADKLAISIGRTPLSNISKGFGAALHAEWPLVYEHVMHKSDVPCASRQ